MANRHRAAVVGLLPSLTLLAALAVAAADGPGDQAADRKKYPERSIVIVPPGAVIDSDYFASGRTVRISGTVNGDVYAAAGEVMIDGTVNGDLLAAGGTVTVAGKVAQDIRVAGGRVTVSGAVGKDATVAGGDITLGRSGSIKESLAAAGGTISVAGPVGRDVRIMGGTFSLSDRVGGDLTAAARRIVLAPGAEVAGAFTYRSPGRAYIDEQAKIAGPVTYIPLERIFPSWHEVAGFVSGLFLFFKIVSYISSFIIGLLLLFLFPGFTRSAVETLKDNPWGALGVGFALFVVNPLLIVLLFISVIGVPLAFVLLALYLVSMYVARLFVILWAGRAIMQRGGKERHAVWSLVLGMLVYIVLSLTPVLGGFVALFTTLFGLGAAGVTIGNLYRRSGSSGEHAA